MEIMLPFVFAEKIEENKTIEMEVSKETTVQRKKGYEMSPHTILINIKRTRGKKSVLINQSVILNVMPRFTFKITLYYTLRKRKKSKTINNMDLSVGVKKCPELYMRNQPPIYVIPEQASI